MAAPGSTPAAAPGTLILAIFTAIRLVLVLDLIPAALSESLASPALASALVNPLHTVHHLREGNFLLELAASAAGEGNGGGTFDQAYEGMVFHLPPLVLFLFRPTFALVASKDVQDAIIGVVFAVVDLGVALTLYDLACSILLDPTDASRREASLEAIMENRIRPMRAWVFGLVPREAGPRKEYIPAPIVEVRDLPRLCCLLYYCNPVSVLACCGTAVQSLHSLWYLAFLLSLREATKSAPNLPLATFFLSVVSYVELYPVVFLIPIALFIGRTRNSCIGTSVFGQAGIECLIWFALWSGALQALSALLVGDWIGVCSKTYGYVFGFSDLSPNMGMNWYFFIQMFDRFRRFYVVMLSLIPLVFVAPLTIRLRAYPAVLVAAFFLAGPNAARRIDWHCPTTAGATYLGEDGQRCAGMHLCDPRTGLSLPDGLLALAVNGVGQCQLHVLPVPCVQRVFGDMHAGLCVIVSKAGQGTAAYGEGTRKG